MHLLRLQVSPQYIVDSADRYHTVGTSAFAASQKTPKFGSLVNAMRGKGNPAEPTYMTIRERIDFAIIIVEFGVLTGV